MIINDDCFNYIKTIESNSIDLILVDPPYQISRSSGFTNYSEDTNDEMKSKYGKLSIDFGKWDKDEIDWDLLLKEYYRILKKGGTLIFFFDIWKSSIIKDAAELNKFKQPRVCSWIKNNPVPVNSKLNYLSNAIEYFFTFTKVSKPTFNSEYDNGLYKYPICHGKERCEHPTQKPLELIKDLIKKHSNEGDLVLDTFAGTFTVHNACDDLKRVCISIEKEEKYFIIGKNRINKNRIELNKKRKIPLLIYNL
jgi:site-specific DNA-methyltransferase (adenine-specific)